MLNSLPHFFSGINGTVVVVGVQCLFVAVFCVGTGSLFFHLTFNKSTLSNEKIMCLLAWVTQPQKV
jgi:hypothetical protein